MLPEELLLRGVLGRRRRLLDEAPGLLELEPAGLGEGLGPPLRERPPPPLGRLPLEGAPRRLPLSPLRAGGPDRFLL